MELEILKNDFSVCKVSKVKKIIHIIESEDPKYEFTFYSRTDNEYSIVCPSNCIDFQTTNRDDNWKALRISGELDFSLVGILAKIAQILAEYEISIFAVSTYDTDYILLKEHNLENAIQVLKANNYQINVNF